MLVICPVFFRNGGVGQHIASNGIGSSFPGLSRVQGGQEKLFQNVEKFTSLGPNHTVKQG